ncbi:DUF222 domain-containing protein [Microbacterium resistens]
MPDLIRILQQAAAALASARSDGATLTRADLIAANDAAGLVRRRLDAVHAEIAARIAEESRPELGPESLAKQQGFRTPAHLIATSTGASAGEAQRLVKVGEATAPRTNLIGEPMPARYPAVQAALHAGTIGASAAGAVIALLDRVRVKVGAQRIAEAEQVLTEQVPGLSMDEIRRLIVRAEAWLDPDGVAPREEQLRAQRSLTIVERDGMIHLDGRFDPESGAPLLAAIDGYVSAEFAATREGRRPGAVDADRRPVAQIRADALSHLAAHALGCERSTPLNGATVVVRVGLDDLQTGTGSAMIDGIAQPVSIATARRMAAGGSVIPWVCGSRGEVLDWGRRRRLFSRAQKLALTERDGGCAMCGLPPHLTRVHHIRWWQRDTGPTDLDNGVLLCETCHHLIHDNGWDIRIDGTGVAARVWFLPPPWTDPARTPRLGGRARTDPALLSLTG